MALTLNQIKTRLESLARSHNQINTTRFVGIDEALDDSDIIYPACIIELQENNRIELSQRHIVFNFKIYFFDLLNVASKSLDNEFDALSDLSLIAADYLAMLNFGEYLIGENSWDISLDNNMKLSTFELQDICAGVSLDVAVSTRYDANRCQVPSNEVTFETDNTMKIISNHIHTIANESSTLTLSALANKELLMVWLGDKLLVPTISAPASPNEYRYTSATGYFEFGTDTQQEQILQILNRNL